MTYINSPNFPKGMVTDVIASSEITTISEYKLNSYGISVHQTKSCNTLYDAVKFHPDMIFHHLQENQAIIEPSQAAYYKSIFPTLNICSGRSVTNKYPDDIAYNCARIGQYLLCNSKYTDENIISHANDNGLEIINIKQGYAKCNICPITENAIITSDEGIKTALRKFPVDVLLINDSTVKLKGFKHGFFGGSTGKISYDKLAVNGNIKAHINADEIIRFAKKYSVEIISLNDNYIEDIGSILPISEK